MQLPQMKKNNLNQKHMSMSFNRKLQLGSFVQKWFLLGQILQKETSFAKNIYWVYGILINENFGNNTCQNGKFKVSWQAS